MVITICSDCLVVDIDTEGAQLISVKHNGKQMLWQNNNGSWSSHAPVLFPVCGKVTAFVDGTQFDLPQHGVVRHQQFEAHQVDHSTATFTAYSNDETRVNYPFEWKYTLTYSVCDDTLTVTHDVTNTDSRDMYYSLGGHESFLLDTDVDQYVVSFPDDKQLCGLQLDTNGRLNGESVHFADNGVTPLPIEHLEKTMIFAGVKSRRALLCHVDGTPIAETTFDGFENVLLWRPRGGHTVCIEPWLNLPDSAQNFAPELKDKPGFQTLAPKQTQTFVRNIKYI